jgi:hypothetical protein
MRTHDIVGACVIAALLTFPVAAAADDPPGRGATLSCVTKTKNGKPRPLCTVVVQPGADGRIIRVVLVRAGKSYKTADPVASGGKAIVRWTPRPALPKGDYTIKITERTPRIGFTWQDTGRIT